MEKERDKFAKYREQLEQIEKYRNDNLKGGHLSGPTCPNCGYCPHCGRGGHHTYPSNPWITYTSDTLYR